MKKPNQRKTGLLSGKILFAILLLISTSPLTAQAPLQWQRLYERPGTISGSNYISAHDVAYTEGGSVIVAGATNQILPGTSVETDACILKYNADGTVINSYFQDYNSTGGTDKVVRIILKGSSIYALIQGQFNVTPTFDYDIQVVKMDTNFVVSNTTYFNGVGNVSDFPIDMGIDQLGNIYVVGNTSRAATGGDIVLLKYDSNLSPMFTKYYSSTGIGNDEAAAMKVESNGVCNITGYSADAIYGSRMLVMKYWGNGVLLWKKFHDVAPTTTGGDFGNAITYDPVSGDLYVTGRGFNSTNYDWSVVKFRGIDGAKLWTKLYAGLNNFDDSGVDIVYFNPGAVYVTGNSKSTVSGITNPSIVLRKLNPADGSQLWAKNYTGITATGSVTPLGATATSMVVTPSENIYVLGTTGIQTPTYAQANHLVLKYTSSGVSSWKDLQPSGSTSGFQAFTANRGIYDPTYQSLYVAGRKNVTMSFQGYMSIIKYGPTTLATTSEAIVDIDSRISASTENDLNFSAFPNPFNEIISVSSSENESVADIKIISMTGQLVYEVYSQKLPLDINTSEFSSGIYQMHIYSEGTIITKRIVKD